MPIALKRSFAAVAGDELAVEILAADHREAHPSNG
jgi:hypothetical protein